MLLTLSRDGNQEIYVMSLEDGRLERLTHNAAIDVSPSWSPDGRASRSCRTARDRLRFTPNREGEAPPSRTRAATTLPVLVS